MKTDGAGKLGNLTNPDIRRLVAAALEEAGPCAADLELLSIAQVTRLLRLHRRTLERMVRAREFPPPRLIKGQRRWSAEAVRKWLGKQPVEKV